MLKDQLKSFLSFPLLPHIIIGLILALWSVALVVQTKTAFQQALADDLDKRDKAFVQVFGAFDRNAQIRFERQEEQSLAIGCHLAGGSYVQAQFSSSTGLLEQAGSCNVPNKVISSTR